MYRSLGILVVLCLAATGCVNEPLKTAARGKLHLNTAMGDILPGSYVVDYTVDVNTTTKGMAYFTLSVVDTDISYKQAVPSRRLKAAMISKDQLWVKVPAQACKKTVGSPLCGVSLSFFAGISKTQIERGTDVEKKICQVKAANGSVSYVAPWRDSSQISGLDVLLKDHMGEVIGVIEAPASDLMHWFCKEGKLIDNPGVRY